MKIPLAQQSKPLKQQSLQFCANYFIVLFKLKNIANHFTYQFNRIILYYAFKGVDNELDDSKQRYIIYLNLIAIVTLLVNIISTIVFLCVNEFLAALAMWVGGFGILIWPFYLNRNGLTLASRIGYILYTNIVIIIVSCIFSHQSVLENYFLCITVNSNFIYTSKERKWLLLSIFFSLLCFIIESTSLQNLLPNLNLINNFEQGDKIILFGVIMTVVLDVLAAVYINSLRERSLLEKQKQLEEAQKLVLVQNDDLKTFSIAASHSMQTPLHISSFCLKKIKENESANLSDTEYEKYLSLIDTGLSQVEQLVSGLFSYNRIINLENEITPLDISKEVNRIQKSITPLYPNSIIITPFFEQKIMVNKMLFTIIIQNLIDNGLKYNCSDIPEVKLDFTFNKGWLDILVKDNGVGIPEVYIDRIFMPFTRIQSGAEFRAGNGLGLAGAKRAAERMGGNLMCLESNQHGTVFKLSIPVILKNQN